MSQWKVSLHRDRTCLLKVTDEHREQMIGEGIDVDRKAYASWTRPEAPVDGYATALVVTFPTLGLDPFGEIPNRPIHWLPPAPKGQAVKVAVVYTPVKSDRYEFVDDPECRYLDGSPNVISFRVAATTNSRCTSFCFGCGGPPPTRATRLHDVFWNFRL